MIQVGDIEEYGLYEWDHDASGRLWFDNLDKEKYISAILDPKISHLEIHVKGDKVFSGVVNSKSELAEAMKKAGI